MPRIKIFESSQGPGRPKKIRYDAILLSHPKHWHRCGPFTIMRQTPERLYVEDCHRTPFELPRNKWVLEAVK